MGLKIGEFLVERGLLTPEQVKQILEYSQRTGLRFGDAGIQLNLLTPKRLARNVPFFNLNPDYFPEGTRGVLSVDSVLKLGALPLGIKEEKRWFRPAQTVLNIGLIDPWKRGIIDEVEAAVTPELRRMHPHLYIKLYLVLADQFLDTVKKAYGVGPSEISQRPAQELDPSLIFCLEAGSQ